MKYIFCILISIKVFCKLILSFLMGLARHVKSTQTRQVWLSRPVNHLVQVDFFNNLSKFLFNVNIEQHTWYLVLGIYGISQQDSYSIVRIQVDLIFSDVVVTEPRLKYSVIQWYSVLPEAQFYQLKSSDRYILPQLQHYSIIFIYLY